KGVFYHAPGIPYKYRKRGDYTERSNQQRAVPDGGIYENKSKINEQHTACHLEEQRMDEGQQQRKQAIQAEEKGQQIDGLQAFRIDAIDVDAGVPKPHHLPEKVGQCFLSFVVYKSIGDQPGFVAHVLYPDAQLYVFPAIGQKESSGFFIHCARHPHVKASGKVCSGLLLPATAASGGQIGVERIVYRFLYGSKTRLCLVGPSKGI